MIRPTHTVAILEVSGNTYHEIAGKLRKAAYDHVFDGKTIDMTGIGLQPKTLALPTDDDIGNGEYAGTQEAMQAAIDSAVLEGLEIIEGAPNVLLVDLDDGAELNEGMLKKMQELFGPTEMESWPSKSGTGKHVRVTFTGDLDIDGELTDRALLDTPEFTPAEAMVLEAALGSDPLRSVLGVRRIRNKVLQTRLLFRRPEDAPRAADVSAVDTTDDLPF